MSHRLGRYPAVFCFLAVFAVSPTTSGEKPFNSPLKLVTGPHYAPYAADYLPHKGLAPFLITRILKTDERTVTVDIRPWKRAYRETLGGQYDGILPYVETSDRQEDFLFSDPIFKADAYAYVRADSELTVRSLEGLKGLTYCNPVGFTDENALAEMRSKGDITRIKPANLISCFNMLKAGRVDFVKTNHHVAHHFIGANNLSDNTIKPLPFVVEPMSLHLMVPKSRPDAEEFINEFNQRFKAMQQAGQIRALTETYLDALAPAAKRDAADDASAYPRGVSTPSCCSEPPDRKGTPGENPGNDG